MIPMFTQFLILLKRNLLIRFPKSDNNAILFSKMYDSLDLRYLIDRFSKIVGLINVINILIKILKLTNTSEIFGKYLFGVIHIYLQKHLVKEQEKL